MNTPVAATLPLSYWADRALIRLAAVSRARDLQALTGTQLMLERAHLLGLSFQDGVAPGGACRLLRARDGAIALNLPRAEDWELLPAWLEVAATTPHSWQAIIPLVAQRSSRTLLERARLLGLAAAVAEDGRRQPTDPEPWQAHGPPLGTVARRPAPLRPPRVVDLSGLWAGPLCAHLLWLCGAEVIKVESLQRPDGARLGNRHFYALLNQGKRSVALDLSVSHGPAQLRRLIAGADIVIESSRPRALRQLDVVAEVLMRSQPRLTWISITGYGRQEPEANWVAYGDDAGVAAGLSRVMHRATGRYQFAGDAIADPLTGIQAALAAWLSYASGGGRLIELALTRVARAALADETRRLGETALTAGFGAWWRSVKGLRPGPEIRPRPVTAPVATLGAHTQAELKARPC